MQSVGINNMDNAQEYYLKKYIKCPICKGTGRIVVLDKPLLAGMESTSTSYSCTECEEGFVKKFVKESI